MRRMGRANRRGPGKGRGAVAGAWLDVPARGVPDVLEETKGGQMTEPDLFAETTVTVDRSALESAANCPMQMRLKRESPNVAGNAAAIGQEAHDAISRTISDYIEATDGGEIWRAGEVHERLVQHVQNSRPDVQPEACEALKAAAYAIARTIAATDPDNILKFDGGDGDRSGMVAWEPFEGFTVATELDLCRATESKQVLDIDDWKSGWGHWTTSDVARSFQFTTQAVCAFHVFHEVQEINVRVWNLRHGYPLQPVQFYRRRLEQYQARVRAAVDVWTRYDSCDLADVPCWPTVEKCRICDCAARCPAASHDFGADPRDWLRGLIAANAKAEALTEALKGAVAANGGRPIVTPDGDCFGKYGAEKPRETWKVKPAVEP
ncbi:MAG: hypothetical protein E6Q97_18320 [Desulfurellales bacterium]|nr:MAG: hypothetical protein E6Q97_18320 [Desulfurellales bacterium]